MEGTNRQSKPAKKMLGQIGQQHAWNRMRVDVGHCHADHQHTRPYLGRLKGVHKCRLNLQCCNAMNCHEVRSGGHWHLAAVQQKPCTHRNASFATRILRASHEGPSETEG